MPVLIPVALLGAIFGSFLNALLFRYNTGRSIANGRSKCMRCGHTLGVGDLVPVLSYLFLKGRCRYCATRISVQYVLVELAAMVLAVAVYLKDPSPLAFSLGFATWLTLLFIVVYDLRHQIIPWSASITLAILALLSMSEFTGLTLLAGPLLMLPLFLLSLVSGGRWMGWGDSALQLGLGWLLGLTAGLTALLIACWTGGVVGIMLAALSKRYTMKSEVPFAPFLIWGAACAYFFNVDLFPTLPALFL